MRIVFMGTPDFAVGTLQALVESGKHEIAAVVTQPDRPKGRGQKMLMTPVKEYALSQGLPVYQPAKVETRSGAITSGVLTFGGGDTGKPGDKA